MAYMATSPTGTTIVSPITYTVTPTDPVNAVVIGPVTASWFQIYLDGSVDYDGTTLIEYEDVTGSFTFNTVVQGGGDALSRADAVVFIGFGGGNWGSFSGGSRPKLNASGQLRIRVRVSGQATQGSLRVLVRLLP